MSTQPANKNMFFAEETLTSEKIEAVARSIEEQLKPREDSLDKMRASLESLLNLLSLDRGILALYDSFAVEYRMVSDAGKKRQVVGERQHKKWEIVLNDHVQQKMIQGLPFVDNGAEASNFYSENYPEHDVEVTSLMILPIGFEDDLAGIVLLMDYEKERFWSPQEIEICQQAVSVLEKSFAFQTECQRFNMRDPLFYKILNHIPLALFWKNRKLEYMGGNQAYVDFFGVALETFVGKTAYEIRPIYYAQEADEIEREMLKGNVAPKSVVSQINNKRGDERWLRITRVPIFDSSDEVVVIIGVMEDITTEIKFEATESRHAKELEYALKQAERANAAKTDFLSRMSHEIRTPLNAVIGLTQVAEESEDIALLHELISKIQSASKSLYSIVNDLLDMSRIEADKMSIVNTSFVFENMLSEVFDIVTSSAEEKGIHLVVEVDYNLPDQLIGDRNHLAQVLLNLLSNAVKFTGAGGIVRLAISVREQDFEDLQVEFQVIDNGIGMSEELIARLFKPFEQAHFDEMQQKQRGTGLGLPIARRLVDLMGGNLMVESVEGEGSTFTFSLPFRTEAGARNVLEKYVHRFKGLKILKIGNNSDIASTHFTHYLETLGARITAEDDEKQVLKLLKANQRGEKHFDVLIVDYSLSAVDEFLMVQTVIEYFDHDRIILLTSGVDSFKMFSLAQQLDIGQVLSRPLLPGKLVGAVQKATGYTQEESIEKMVPNFEGARILIVEDIQVNREILRYFLEGTNVIMDEAVNGREAVELYEKNNGEYHLIYMDVQMPVMDGHEATIAIRDIERSTGKHVPIYAMTASAYGADIRRCMDVGMDDHISKPYHKSEIFETIAKALYKNGSMAQEKRIKAEKKDREELTPVAELIEETSEYIDWKHGLGRVMNDKEFYINLLSNFKNSALESRPILEDSWEAQEERTLLGELHALKGTTKNLALSLLAAKLTTMEEKVIKKEATQEDMEELLFVLDETLRAINKTQEEK